MRICVVAMGKIGLPLAVQFASKGHEVIGCDVNPETVALVNAGTEPFPGEAHLQTMLTDVVSSGALRATTNTTEAVRLSEAVVIVVPLFTDADGVPDFDWMDAATRDVAQGLQPGSFVSYETTLPVGTTRTRFAPMLEAGSGLKAGVDFTVAFSPERVFTGRVFEDLRKYPKLVGGIDSASGEAACRFYEAVLDFDERSDLSQPNGVWDLGSSEASEMAKLAETTYRDVNIALANEFARFASANDIDIQAVIEACNSQPFSHIHQPGIAVGGHCIPIYPRMYLWNDPDATVVRAARERNASMPDYVVHQLAAMHGSLSGQRVVVLGAAYRGGVKETAFSGVFPTVSALQDLGAVVTVHDPMFTAEELRAMALPPHELGAAVDAAILQANHEQYQHLSNDDLPGLRTFIDGRNFCRVDQFPGVVFHAVGRGGTAQ